MPVPVWPADLPELRGDATGTVDSLYPQNITTQFDDGPPRVRRVALWSETQMTIGLVLPDEGQLESFKMFLSEDLNNGVRRFIAPVWCSDGTLQNKNCRVIGGLSVTWIDGCIPKVQLTVGIEDW